MEINPETSRRITILRFPLIAAIVLIHGGINMEISPSTIFVSTLGTNILARVAVPLFFVMSGWLFFINFNLTLKDYIKKIKSRFFTLCIPYLFWNLSFLLLVFSLQSFPFTASFLENNFQKLVAHYNFQDYLEAFGVMGGDPILLPLWFLRDLIYLVIISPIFYIIAQKTPALSLLIILLPLLPEANLPFVNLRFISSLVFFYLGCLIAVQRWDVTQIDRWNSLILPAYLLLAISLSVLRTTHELTWGNQIQFLLNCLGVMAAWCLSQKILETKLETLLIALTPFTFFVYAAHEPTAMVLRKILSRFFPASQPSIALLYYFLIPFLAITITLAVAKILKKYLPQFFNIITGGRVN